jgi:hypothetical protein
MRSEMVVRTIQVRNTEGQVLFEYKYGRGVSYDQAIECALQELKNRYPGEKIEIGRIAWEDSEKAVD